jgi:hypothetical protein
MRSESVDPITAAVAAGAASGLTAVASQAIKDAYSRLKAALDAKYPDATPSLLALEARPDSEAKQQSLAEELADGGGNHDVTLLQLAEALMSAVERDAPSAIRRAGVDLRKLKTEGSVRIKKAQGTDVGVHGDDWDVQGDLVIDDARGGGGPDPNR